MSDHNRFEQQYAYHFIILILEVLMYNINLIV